MFGAPVRVIPFKFRRDLWCQQTRVLSYRVVLFA